MANSKATGTFIAECRKRKRAYTEGSRGKAECNRPGSIEVGDRCFPNKKILRNSPCLPCLQTKEYCY